MEEYLGSDHLTTEEVGRFGQFKNFFPYSSKRQISSFQIFQPPPPPLSKAKRSAPYLCWLMYFNLEKAREKSHAFQRNTSHVAEPASPVSAQTGVRRMFKFCFVV